MAASVPTHLDIPDIGVHSSLIKLGLAGDGTIDVPPLTKDAPAGWYDRSPTPGQIGPAVLLGHVHVNSYDGVFSKLSELKPGALISVSRADGTTAEFVVTHLATYPKDNFPAQSVYGNTATPQLRLITCAGLDKKTHTYRDNTVVYATLH